jgi:hypothetical protein
MAQDGPHEDTHQQGRPVLSQQSKQTRPSRFRNQRMRCLSISAGRHEALQFTDTDINRPRVVVHNSDVQVATAGVENE